MKSALTRPSRRDLTVALLSVVAYGLVVALCAALSPQGKAVEPTRAANCAWGGFA